jgi:hypothetical protein
MPVTLIDYVSGEQIRVEPRAIDDALARRLLPQDETVQRLYGAARRAGLSVVGSMSRAIILQATVYKRLA